MAYLVFATTIVFAVSYGNYLFESLEAVELSWFAIGLLGFKTDVEIVASYYGFAYVFTAVAYFCEKILEVLYRVVKHLTSHHIFELAVHKRFESEFPGLRVLTFLRSGHPKWATEPILLRMCSNRLPAINLC